MLVLHKCSVVAPGFPVGERICFGKMLFHHWNLTDIVHTSSVRLKKHATNTYLDMLSPKPLASIHSRIVTAHRRNCARLLRPSLLSSWRRLLALFLFPERLYGDIQELRYSLSHPASPILFKAFLTYTTIGWVPSPPYPECVSSSHRA